jgi:hypothetical protein
MERRQQQLPAGKLCDARFVIVGLVKRDAFSIDHIRGKVYAIDDGNPIALWALPQDIGRFDQRRSEQKQRSTTRRSTISHFHAAVPFKVALINSPIRRSRRGRTPTSGRFGRASEICLTVHREEGKVKFLL